MSCKIQVTSDVSIYQQAHVDYAVWGTLLLQNQTEKDSCIECYLKELPFKILLCCGKVVFTLLDPTVYSCVNVNCPSSQPAARQVS